jgi:hypothetical protein
VPKARRVDPVLWFRATFAESRRKKVAKKTISNGDLAALFNERLKSFAGCPVGVTIAIVPAPDGWRAMTSYHTRTKFPLCAKRVEVIQRQLRKIYKLAKD